MAISCWIFCHIRQYPSTHVGSHVYLNLLCYCRLHSLFFTCSLFHEHVFVFLSQFYIIIFPLQNTYCLNAALTQLFICLWLVCLHLCPLLWHTLVYVIVSVHLTITKHRKNQAIRKRFSMSKHSLVQDDNETIKIKWPPVENNFRCVTCWLCLCVSVCVFFLSSTN